MSPIRLKYVQTYVFYDKPQLFIAEDESNSKYLCLLYSEDNSELDLKYLAIRISEKQLDLFKNQGIDLLSIYQNPEDACYFDVSVKDRGGIIGKHLSANQVQPFMLPDAGFYY